MLGPLLPERPTDHLAGLNPSLSRNQQKNDFSATTNAKVSPPGVATAVELSVKSSQVVGLRTRVASIRTLIFSSPHPYAGSGEV